MRLISTLLILIIFRVFSLAQDFAIEGIVINSENGTPVSYASVCLQNETKGISTNEKGAFRLILQTKDLKKQIVISAIGYYDTVFSISTLNKNAVNLKLKPRSYQIPEAVVVVSHKIKTIIIDKLRKSIFKQVMMAGPSNPKIVAKNFKYIEKYDGFYLNEISIFFDREFDYSIKPKFILRVFAKDTINNTPGKDLISKALITLDKSKPQMHYKYTYKLENPIKFPKTGLFVGIEWIAIKENKYNEKRKAYSPFLAGKYRKRMDNNLWEFYGGSWKLKSPVKDNSEPYIELRLIK
ncbi:MAG: carboxypeptidase-like regulatory domain-containing protein [Bacteroidales bacterium]|nr:carboxypeptidase-like regulatory domain-containing protein [Bacteroidales bacterium]